MQRVVPLSLVRLAIALAAIAVIGVAVGSRGWPVGGEETRPPAVRVSYHYDYDADNGLVMRGQRDACVASWPANTMAVTLREAILLLAAEDGMWIWSGTDDDWRASGLPDPCAGQLLADG